MLTRTDYKVTSTDLAVRYFSCAHCGAYGEVIFGAVGRGWSRENYWESDGQHRAERAAENDLRTDAARTQALVECPTCGLRAKGAVRWAGIRIGFWVALTIALPIISSTFVLGAIPVGAMGIWQAWRERGRFLRARGAIIRKLEPGTIPEAEVAKPKPLVRRQLAPPPDLPQARVVMAPPPVAHDEPADPSGAPKFLKP